MRVLPVILGVLLLIGAVAVPAAAEDFRQPKVEIGGKGEVWYFKVLDGNLFGRARQSFMWATGPGLYTYQTGGTVNHSYNPALARDEFDIVFGQVEIFHPMDGTRISGFIESLINDMFTSAGGCGWVAARGDGTLRIGGKTWIGSKPNTFVLKPYSSKGNRCH